MGKQDGKPDQRKSLGTAWRTFVRLTEGQGGDATRGRRVLCHSIFSLAMIGAVVGATYTFLSASSLSNPINVAAGGSTTLQPKLNQLAATIASDCRASSSPNTELTGALVASGASATFKVGQLTSVAFGQSTGAKHLILLLTLDQALRSPTQPVQVRVDTFRRGDDGRLDPKFILITSSVDGESVLLDVCFDRVGDHLGNPGTYLGSVTVVDPRLAGQVTIPITVTMQYVHEFRLLWLLVWGIIPGSWLLWMSKGRESEEPFFLSWRWFDWMLTPSGIIAVTTGSVAAFSVFVATYLKNPTWGASPTQSIALYGSMFSGFVATSHIAHAGAAYLANDPSQQAGGNVVKGASN
jgi:hypothetical protein